MNAFIRYDREGNMKLVWVNEIFLAWPNPQERKAYPRF